MDDQHVEAPADRITRFLSENPDVAVEVINARLRREGRGHIMVTLATSPEAQPPAGDDWCPCGHAVGCEMTRCIAGRVYGPCSSDVCGGVCEFEGDCPSADCKCKEED